MARRIPRQIADSYRLGDQNESIVDYIARLIREQSRQRGEDEEPANGDAESVVRERAQRRPAVRRQTSGERIKEMMAKDADGVKEAMARRKAQIKPKPVAPPRRRIKIRRDEP